MSSSIPLTIIAWVAVASPRFLACSINRAVMVVTVIESLRAFDLVYITSGGNPLKGLELLSVAVTQNIVGETQRIGFGSTLGVILLVISLVPITIFLTQAFRREENQS